MFTWCPPCAHQCAGLSASGRATDLSQQACGLEPAEQWGARRRRSVGGTCNEEGGTDHTHQHVLEANTSEEQKFPPHTLPRSGPCCYELNVRVPRIYMWKLSPQCGCEEVQPCERESAF